MDTPAIQDVTADQLREYIQRHHENEYLLVDVRQPAEYRQDHIPGALLMPLPELESRLYDLPADRDIVFYCRSGSRSMMAAILVSEGEVTSEKIYNLGGGINAWDGVTLQDFPKVQVFEHAGSLTELLKTAMDLEKGAERYYSHLQRKYAGHGFAPLFERLAKAERAHASAIFQFWKKNQTSSPVFAEFYQQLPGRILEGGQHLEDILEQIENIQDNPCLNLIELSLRIEYAAFDLYRYLAHRAESETARHALVSIAQAEKNHMRFLAAGIDQCAGV